jgi:hypothetical protein
MKIFHNRLCGLSGFKQERRFTFSSSISTLILCFIGAISILAAQDLSFEASVDRTTVGLGETFTLNVTVSGENIGPIPQPELPSLPDFNVLGQSQSQATNISWVNGKTSRQSTINFIYSLAPQKIGKSTIGPCRLKYKDKTYETQPIEIEAVKAGSQPAPGPGPSTAPGPAPAANAAVNDNLMIAATASRRSVYLGEEVNVEYDLYSRYNIQEYGDWQMPTFSSFWTEKIYEANQLNFQRRVVNGKAYDFAVLKKIALFPMTSGDLRIDPIALTVAIVQPPKDFFDGFGTIRTVRVESKPITVSVLPLPEPKPPEFTGGVGIFTVTSSLDRDSSVNSEPINLVLRFSGQGNIRLIEKPRIPEIPGLRILDPEVKDGVNTTNEIVEGFKEFRYPIIPQADGQYLIPAVALAYFNPKTKVYETIRTGELKFTATRTSPSVAVSDASGLKILGVDINYIKPDAARLSPQSAGVPWWLWLFYPFSLAAIGYSFWFRGRREKLTADRSYARFARSNKLARKRLRNAEANLKKRDQQGFFFTLSQAVIGYAGDRFDLEAQALTKDQIKSALLQKGVSPDTVEQFIGIIDQCDYARFSPSLTDFKDPEELLNRTKELLGRL